MTYRKALRNPKKDGISAISANFQTKDIFQQSPTFLKVGIGGGSGCFATVFLAFGCIPLLLLVVTLVVSEDSVWAWPCNYRGLILLLALGLPFALAGFATLFLQWQFMFDKEKGEMTAGNILFKRSFPLTAIQSVEHGCGGGVGTNRTQRDGDWSSRPSTERSAATMECRLVLKIDDEEFCLSLWNHARWGVGRSNAEQLAEFLEVPIGGDRSESK